MKNFKHTFLSKIAFAGFICLQTAPTYAMMAQVRAGVVRAYQGMQQGIRPTAASFSNIASSHSIAAFSKGVPALHLQARLSALATAKQPSQQTAAGFFLPLLAAGAMAAYTACRNDWVEERITKVPQGEHFAFLEEYIRTRSFEFTGFKQVYDLIGTLSENLLPEEKKQLKLQVFKRWIQHHRFFPKECDAQELHEVKTIFEALAPKHRCEWATELMETIEKTGVHVDTKSKIILALLESLPSKQQKELLLPFLEKHVLGANSIIFFKRAYGSITELSLKFCPADRIRLTEKLFYRWATTYFWGKPYPEENPEEQDAQVVLDSVPQEESVVYARAMAKAILEQGYNLAQCKQPSFFIKHLPKPEQVEFVANLAIKSGRDHDILVILKDLLTTEQVFTILKCVLSKCTAGSSDLYTAYPELFTTIQERGPVALRLLALKWLPKDKAADQLVTLLNSLEDFPLDEETVKTACSLFCIFDLTQALMQSNTKKSMQFLAFAPFVRSLLLPEHVQAMLFSDHLDTIIEIGEVLLPVVQDPQIYGPYVQSWPLEGVERIIARLLHKNHHGVTHFMKQLLPVLPVDQRTAVITAIMEKNPTFTPLIKDIIYTLPEGTIRNGLMDRVYKGLLNPFDIKDAQNGPLFQNYFAKHEVQERAVNESTLNFNALLPEIVDYVNEEYKKNRIVLFHGQSSEWIFLEKTYRFLYSFKHGTPPSETFIHTRFQDHSELSQEEVTMLRTMGVSNTMYDQYRFKILFTNLHPFANHPGSNTWYYATNNHDISTSTGRFDFKIALRDMFESLDLTEQYQKLTTQNPDLFEELKKLLNEANKEQGGFGNLLTISMPQEFAQEHVYSTRSGGPITPITINGTNTTSVVDASQNFKQVPEQNEWALILSEEIVNPQAAQKAGIKIVGFNPVSYWRTSKYLAFETKLEEMINLLKEMSNEKNQKNEGKQS